jgi:hypothetical protein
VSDALPTEPAALRSAVEAASQEHFGQPLDDTPFELVRLKDEWHIKLWGGVACSPDSIVAAAAFLRAVVYISDDEATTIHFNAAEHEDISLEVALTQELTDAGHFGTVLTMSDPEYRATQPNKWSPERRRWHALKFEKNTSG